MRQRPLGVKIIGTLLILYAVMDLVGTAGWLANPRRVEERLQTKWDIDPLAFRRELAVSTGKSLVVGVTGIGLLMLQSWARWVFITVLALETLGAMSRILLTGSLTTTAKLLWLSLNIGFFGLLLWYFLRPSVKAQFKRAHST